MIRVAYVNHGLSERCGVHDLGRRHAAAIQSDRLDVRYVECNDMSQYGGAMATIKPDVVVINYMPGIMPWVQPSVQHKSHATVAVIHNYQADTVDNVAAEHMRCFDHVLALDPQLTTDNPRILVTDRPIPATCIELPELDHEPRIGSFGFAFPHKRFDAVAAEIATLDVPATYDLHMPEAFFNGREGAELYGPGIMASIEAELTPEFSVHRTSDHLTPEQIVERLARNHVNCLLYEPGQHNAGLSSALDYLVAARRPILVTDCAMFRHLDYGLNFYPEVRLRDILDDYEPHQRVADTLYEWARRRIANQTAEHFEALR